MADINSWEEPERIIKQYLEKVLVGTSLNYVEPISSNIVIQLKDGGWLTPKPKPPQITKACTHYAARRAVMTHRLLAQYVLLIDQRPDGMCLVEYEDGSSSGLYDVPADRIVAAER